jgi:hypothetical protein
MKIHLVSAEHFRVPGLRQMAFTTNRAAVSEAVGLVNTMLIDSGHQPLASPLQWEHHLERLQDEHGAAHCYVEITELEVAGSTYTDAVRDHVAGEVFVTVAGGVVQHIGATGDLVGRPYTVIDYDVENAAQVTGRVQQEDGSWEPAALGSGLLEECVIGVASVTAR